MAEARFIYGFHAVTSRLRQNVAAVKEIYLDSGRQDRRARDLIERCRSGCRASGYLTLSDAGEHCMHPSLRLPTNHQSRITNHHSPITNHGFLMAEARFIYGFHAVTSRLRQNAAAVKEIYLDSGREDRRARDLIELAESRGARVMLIDGKRLDGMTGNARHQGVAARVEGAHLPTNIDDALEKLSGPPLLLILDGVTDPHNLGACLRVADAMGVHAVIAPKDRAVGINPTVSKVASGAAETVPYIPVTNLARTMRELKEREIWLIGADAKAEQDLYSARLRGALAWVLGAEGEGLRRLTRETCDELVRIPMRGSVESLNVSVAAGICLGETRRQRRLGSGK